MCAEPILIERAWVPRCDECDWWGRRTRGYSAAMVYVRHHDRRCHPDSAHAAQADRTLDFRPTTIRA